MRLNTKPLGFVINFILGVAWGFVLLGAIVSFLSLYEYGLIYAIVSLFIGIVPGMIMVVLVEHIITTKEKYYELQKQTKLLRDLLLQKKDEIVV